MVIFHSFLYVYQRVVEQQKERLSDLANKKLGFEPQYDSILGKSPVLGSYKAIL